jgi:5-methylcytosine-specific restriction protein A
MARTHGHGNPKWTKDEIILALDLYFDCQGNIPSHKDKRVIELSHLLRTLPYHANAARRASFRNPDGVLFKLQNLRQVATGRGFSNVSDTDRIVWAEYNAAPEKVKQLANLIRAGIKFVQSAEEEKDFEEDEFDEGRVLTEIHKRRERDPKVRKRLLASRLSAGRLTCEICKNRSATNRIDLEDATFEAHHIHPVSITREGKTKLQDIALLCANCHRLLHRAISIEKRWLDLPEARRIIGFC